MLLQFRSKGSSIANATNQPCRGLLERRDPTRDATSSAAQNLKASSAAISSLPTSWSRVEAAKVEEEEVVLGQRLVLVEVGEVIQRLLFASVGKSS